MADKTKEQQVPEAGSFAQLRQQPTDLAPQSRGLSMPQADENILKNTKLLQAQPGPHVTGPHVTSVYVNDESGPAINANPWQGIDLVKVPLNKQIQLGYLSEEHLKQVIERLHNIQTYQQKKFRKIISEMQQDDNPNQSVKSSNYSSKIIQEQARYNFNILFLDFSHYLKSLFHPPTRRIFHVADLVYPQGILMQWAFRRLSTRQPQRSTGKAEDTESLGVNPSYEFQTRFDFTVSLLSDLDEHGCSVFLVGGTNKLLNKVEKSFQTSFHRIQILGRHYSRNCRKNKRIHEVRTVINKSSPTLLLVAKRASIHDFVDDKNGERKVKSFLVLDYPNSLRDLSGKYRRRKVILCQILSIAAYCVFPWKWPKLFCIVLFFLKISFSVLPKDRIK